METFRFAHVVTCWVYLASLVLQFAFAGWGVMGGDLEVHMAFGGIFLHLVVPLVLMLTAWLGKLGGVQVLLGLGLFGFITLQISLVPIGRELESTVVRGLHPAFALLSAGYVYFWVLERALDVQRRESPPDAALIAPPTGRAGTAAGPTDAVS